MMTPRVLPPGYTITTILDAVYAMGTDTAYADGTTRTLAVLTRLPRPVQALLLGTEYYVAVG